MIFSGLLTLALSMTAIDLSALSKDPAFDFYLGDFVDHAYPENKDGSSPAFEVPIRNGLVNAVFDVKQDEDFKSRIRSLQKAAHQNPDKKSRFDRLNKDLERRMSDTLTEMKNRRLKYIAAGAAIGLAAGWLGRNWAASKGMNPTAATAVWLPSMMVFGGSMGYLLSNALDPYDLNLSESGKNANQDLINILETEQ